MCFLAMNDVTLHSCVSLQLESVTSILRAEGNRVLKGQVPFRKH